jgi:tetratricopeptide (TPR) repeat protein
LFHSGKYNQACEVLKEIDHQGLNRFGYYNKIVELRSQLIDKIPSKHLSAENMSHLGRAYRALGDSQKAISFFLPALEVAQDSKNLELERSNLGNLGSAYLAMGGANTDTALDYYLKALDVAKKIRKPGPLGTAFADLGDACYQKGEMERALQYFKDALKIALSMPNNDSAIGADYGRIGNVCFALGRLETVEDYYKKAIEISRKANNRRNIGINLGHLARYYYAIGLYTEGLIFAQESLSISKAIGSRRNEAINLTQMAYLHAGLGDFEKAIALNQQSLKVSYDISDQRAEAINLGHMSVAYIAMGKVDDALQCCRKALELTHGDRRGEGINLLFLSRIHVAMGEIDKAIEYSQSAIDSFNDVGDRRYQREARCQMGIAWHASGDFQKSLDYCQKALANASEINDRRTMSLGYLHLGKVWHHSGDWLKAKEFYGESARLDQSATKYIATMGLGIIGLNEDQREDAIEYFSQGSDLCRELLDKTPSLWEPMQYLALCQLAQGKAAEAKATYKRALEICNAKGVVKAALRELDVLYHAEPELKGIEDVRVMLSAIL